MEEVISKKTFAQLAAVGGIELTAGEAEDLRGEMNRQMRVIRQLEAIPLEEHITPVIHGNPYPEAVRCGLREDIPRPFGNSDGIIAQAPSVRDRCFVSPDVQHQRIG